MIVWYPYVPSPMQCAPDFYSNNIRWHRVRRKRMGEKRIDVERRDKEEKKAMASCYRSPGYIVQIRDKPTLPSSADDPIFCFSLRMIIIYCIKFHSRAMWPTLYAPTIIIMSYKNCLWCRWNWRYLLTNTINCEVAESCKRQVIFFMSFIQLNLTDLISDSS